MAEAEEGAPRREFAIKPALSMATDAELRDGIRIVRYACGCDFSDWDNPRYCAPRAYEEFMRLLGLAP